MQDGGGDGGCGDGEGCGGAGGGEDCGATAAGFGSGPTDGIEGGGAGTEGGGAGTEGGGVGSGGGGVGSGGGGAGTEGGAVGVEGAGVGSGGGGIGAGAGAGEGTGAPAGSSTLRPPLPPPQPDNTTAIDATAMSARTLRNRDHRSNVALQISSGPDARVQAIPSIPASPLRCPGHRAMNALRSTPASSAAVAMHSRFRSSPHVSPRLESRSASMAVAPRGSFADFSNMSETNSRSIDGARCQSCAARIRNHGDGRRRPMALGRSQAACFTRSRSDGAKMATATRRMQRSRLCKSS